MGGFFMEEIMKYLISNVFIIFLLLGCKEQQVAKQAESAPKPPTITPEQQLGEYQSLAWQVVTALQGQSDTQQVKSMLLSLVHSSQGLFLAFNQVFPECKQTLDAITEYVESTPLTAISSDNEPLNLQPELPDFTGPNCYHIQQLLLNPLAVLAMTTQQQMNHVDIEQAELKMIDSLARIKQLELVGINEQEVNEAQRLP